MCLERWTRVSRIMFWWCFSQWFPVSYQHWCQPGTNDFWYPPSNRRWFNFKSRVHIIFSFQKRSRPQNGAQPGSHLDVFEGSSQLQKAGTSAQETSQQLVVPCCRVLKVSSSSVGRQKNWGIAHQEIPRIENCESSEWQIDDNRWKLNLLGQEPWIACFDLVSVFLAPSHLFCIKKHNIFRHTPSRR